MSNIFSLFFFFLFSINLYANQCLEHFHVIDIKIELPLPDKNTSFIDLNIYKDDNHNFCILRSIDGVVSKISAHISQINETKGITLLTSPIKVPLAKNPYPGILFLKRNSKLKKSFFALSYPEEISFSLLSGKKERWGWKQFETIQGKTTYQGKIVSQIFLNEESFYMGNILYLKNVPLGIKNFTIF